MKNHIRALLAAVLPVLLLITAIPSIADTEPVVSAADTFQETAVIRKKLIPLVILTGTRYLLSVIFLTKTERIPLPMLMRIPSIFLISVKIW